LAFEDVPIASEQRRAQREFAKATKEQKQAAIAGGMGVELEQEKKAKERGKLQYAGDIIGSWADSGNRLAKSMLSTIGYFAQTQAATDPMANLPYEKRKEMMQGAAQTMYDNATAAQNTFQNEIAKRNIQTSVLQAINKGQYSRIPESVLYTIGDAAMQIIPSVFTFGGSTYMQTLPQVYKDGVDAIAKEKGISPEQVVASGEDAFLVSQINAGLQSALEFMGAGLVSKSIASRGAYKAMRDYLLKQNVNRSLARGASLLGVGLGEATTEYGQETTGQIGKTAAKSPTAKAFFDKLPNELFTPEARNQRAESFVGGLVGGLALAGGGQAVQSAMDRTLFEAPKIGKATQRADMDIVQTDNKIQERNKIQQAVEEAVKANPEAEGQIRQQYQKRIDAAAPTNEEVLTAYESTAQLPESEEKAKIQQNLEAYMAEKGIQPEPVGQEAGLGELMRRVAPEPPVIQTVNPEFPAPQLTPEEAAQEDEDLAALNEQIAAIEGAPVEEEVVAEQVPVAPAEEEAVVEAAPIEEAPVAAEEEIVAAIPAPAPKGKKKQPEAPKPAPVTTPAAPKAQPVAEKPQPKKEGVDNKIELSLTKGEFVGDILNDYDLIGEGSEHTVYRSKDGTHVLKISEPYNDKSEATFNSRIKDATLISEIIGDGSLEVVGYYESANGTKNPIYRQNFQEGTPLAEKDVIDHLKSIGAVEFGDKNNKGYLISHNGRWYKISDLTDNFFRNKDGKIFAIDAAIQEVPNDVVLEAYNRAKEDGNNPELVKAVDLKSQTTPSTKTPQEGDVESFETSKGSVYTVLPDGRTQRFKTATKELNEPNDLIVFVKFKNAQQEQDFLSAQNRQNGQKLYVIDSKGNKYDTNEQVKGKDVRLAIVKDGKVVETVETSLEPKIGYNTFDQRRYTEKGEGYRSTHLGNKVAKINYKKTTSTNPQEGDAVEIAPAREGGSSRKMVFKDGQWKQEVGGQITSVGESVQKQAQEAFSGKTEAKAEEVLVELGGRQVPKGKGNWRDAFNKETDPFKKKDILRGIADSSTDINELNDIKEAAKGMPDEGNIMAVVNAKIDKIKAEETKPAPKAPETKPAEEGKKERETKEVISQPTKPKGEGATILPSIDADKAEAQLYISQKRNYYTLWYKRRFVNTTRGKEEYTYSYNYLTILSQNLEDARTKALDYLNSIASGESLSVAFEGKNIQNLRGAKTIALQEEVVSPETETIVKSKSPDIKTNFGIGKYSGITIDELLDKDIDYAEWFVNNYTSRGADKTKAIIKGDPRYQEYLTIKRDIQDLERARIEAYEKREAERKEGKQVPVATLVRGEGGKIKEVVEETEVAKKKVEKKERRLVKDQITDIIPPQTKADDKVDDGLKPQMFKAQIDGANTAIASMDKNGVLLNGDGAGVGKTRQIIAVAKYYADKGKPVVIISENAAIGKPWESGKQPMLGGSMAKDSEAMGVNLTLLTDDKKVQPGGIYVSTYNRIQDADVPSGAIVIFDESQNLVNTFGRTSGGDVQEERQWEAKFRPMLKKAGAVAYYSATPADKPHQLAYLYKVLGFNSPEDFLSEMMNNGAIIKTKKYGKQEVKYYDVPAGRTQRARLYNWVNGLMVRAGQEGRFVKREISYEGTDVQFHDVKGTDEGRNEYAKEFNKVLDDLNDAEMMEYRLLAPNSYILYAAELSKIGEAVGIVKKQLAQGRKSIIFVSRINPMEIRGRRQQMAGEFGAPEVIGEIPSPVPMLEEALKKEGISFVGLHSKAKTTSQKAQKAFSEDADVLIASLESGGTGINLDDTIGDNPRTEVFLFSPYRGISTIQGMGRIWRASTIQNDNNPNRYVFVTASDISPDLNRSSVLAKKLQLMNAAIGGTAVSKLPMSKVSYDKEQLVGIELPDDTDEESSIFKEKTGILRPVVIDWKQSRKGGYFAKATADILEWMERGGPERTGLDIRVFKSEDGEWIALAGKNYKAEEFAPDNIPNEVAPTETEPSFTSKQESSASEEFDGTKKPSKIKTKSFDNKYGKGAFERMQNITQNFEDIMDGLSEKIKQDCL